MIVRVKHSGDDYVDYVIADCNKVTIVMNIMIVAMESVVI